MIFILGTLIVTIAHSYERIPEPSDAERLRYNSREFSRLTKLLNWKDFHNPEWDFHFESVRLNVSDGDYSETCFESYVSMKFTPHELYSLKHELGYLMRVQWGNISSELSTKMDRTHTYLILTQRSEVIDRLLKNALPETKVFFRLAQVKFMDTFIAFLSPGRLIIDNIVKEAITQVAVAYRKLTKLVRRDLERSLCVRNTLRWINSDLNGSLDIYFEMFSEVVELRLDNLLKENEYQSSLPIEEVNLKFKRRAEVLNMPVQEYVDICSDMFTVMKLNNEEKDHLNQTTDVFMGKMWGRTVYSTPEDLVDALVAENAPFINIVLKRWNFIRRNSKNPIIRLFLGIEEGTLLDGLLAENNKQYPKYSWLNLRQLEQVFCFRSILESFIGQEMEI